MHDLPQHVVGREAGILRAIDEEAEEAFDIRRWAGPAATKTGVASAEYAMPLWQTAQLLPTRGKPITFFVNPDRQLLALLPGTPSDA